MSEPAAGTPEVSSPSRRALRALLRNQRRWRASSTTTRRLDHVGLNVADLPAAEAWYAEAFGYVRDFEARLDAFELDIVMLVHPVRGDRLELLHRPGSQPGLRASNPPEAVLTQGFGHIAFDVRGVDGAFERLVSLGARPVMEPRPSPEPGVRMAFVADPEGNLVELLDRSGEP